MNNTSPDRSGTLPVPLVVGLGEAAARVAEGLDVVPLFETVEALRGAPEALRTLFAFRARHGETRTEQLVIDPVPEPGVAVLVGVGVMLAALRRRVVRE